MSCINYVLIWNYQTYWTHLDLPINNSLIYLTFFNTTSKKKIMLKIRNWIIINCIVIYQLKRLKWRNTTQFEQRLIHFLFLLRLAGIRLRTQSIGLIDFLLFVLSRRKEWFIFLKIKQKVLKGAILFYNFLMMTTTLRNSFSCNKLSHLYEFIVLLCKYLFAQSL